MAVRKIIHRQKPYENYYGQYAQDLETSALNGVSIMGRAELFSLFDTSEDSNISIGDYPSFLWPYLNQGIELNAIYLRERNNYDTVKGRLHVYFVDDEIDEGIRSAESWDAINAFMTDDRKIYYNSWNEGMGDGQSDRSNKKFGEYGTGPFKEGPAYDADWSSSTMKFYDIPYDVKVGNSIDDGYSEVESQYYYGDGVSYIDGNLQQWSNIVRKKPNNIKGSYWILIKMEGTAEEGGWKNVDRRNKSYQKFEIPKKYFYDGIINKDIDKLIIQFGSRFNGNIPGDGVGYYNYSGVRVSNSTTKNDVTYNWSKPTLYQDTHGTEDDEGGWFGDDKKSAAYECDGLVITLRAPDGNSANTAYNLNNFPVQDYNDGWINLDDPNSQLDLRTDQYFNYMSLREWSTLQDFGINDLFDFRPISYAKIGTSNEYYDLQRFYSQGEGYEYTTAPNRISLTFRISDNNRSWFPTYLDGYNDQWELNGASNSNPGDYDIYNADLSQFGDQRFMFFVYDWGDGTIDDTPDDDLDWENINESIPRTLSDLDYYQDPSIDLFNYTKIYNEDGTVNFLEHVYETPGIKIIKAVVFSYIANPDNTQQILPVKFTAVSTRVHLGIDAAYVEDFTDLASEEFSFLPWPYTTGIIGGLSSNSRYNNSIKDVIQNNYFNSTEILDLGRTLMSNNLLSGNWKDELGNHLGKSDISQFRYFEKPYDMTDLLMLDGIYEGFVRYDDWTYWYSYDEENATSNGMPEYPRNEDNIVNSCVGLLLIEEDNSDTIRKNACIVEYNFNSIEGLVVLDTSGNASDGIVIGDYAIDKADYNEPISRQGDMVLPEINAEKLAF